MKIWYFIVVFVAILIGCINYLYWWYFNKEFNMDGLYNYLVKLEEKLYGNKREDFK